LAWTFVREEPYVHSGGGGAREAAIQLVQAARNPAVLGAAAFLYLWSFNPFSSSSVLYTHMTSELEVDEQFYGISVSVLAVGQIVGSLAYGIYSPKTPVRWLIHGAIFAGVLATVAYWGLSGPKSALVIAFFVGFTYMTGSLAQLDLAARACPVAAAGSVFALLMSVSNLAMSSSELVGGKLYVALGARWGNQAAFQALVGIGALTTCCCWLVAPWLGRAVQK
jgi:predicted MFS family arabinose efflux permease